MPKKKTARDMTTEQLAKRAFPPGVLKEAKRIVRELNQKPEKKKR